MIAFILSLLIAGAWADCASDIQTCMSTFNSKINAAGNNIVQSCQDGDDVLSCLRRSEADAGCAPMLSEIQAQITTATQKLVASGCNPSGGADTCLTDIQQCENELHADTTNIDRSSPTAQCKVAADFLTCLQAIQCSGDNENKVHTSIQQVMNDERLAHCV
ncbi:uncharacterized protein [Littorina saxatilis]|uniref:Uncharacterized protein n=1 Tax=Littorina saxatilis TaxID=31220 RepID=A0AAN9B544_9CAEN